MNQDSKKQEKIVLANISMIRRRKELSQCDVAQALGISQPLYSKMERGQTPLNLTTLCELAVIFQCSIAVFFMQPDNTSLDLNH